MDGIKIGRPRRAPENGTRVSLGLKVTPATKRALDRAADESGRTQSQEAEYRLQASFDTDLLVSRILAASRGEELPVPNSATHGA